MGTSLLISYSGLLGGAERALVQFAGGLDGERWLACPEGPLAGAARAAGLRVAPLRTRRIEFRGAVGDRVLAPLRLLAHGAETRALCDRLAPELIVVCGMRALLGLTQGPRVSGALVFLHNDLLPPGPIGAAVRHAAGRADLVIVPSAAVAADLGVAATVIAPGVEDAFFAAAPAPAQPPEILVLGALVPWKQPAFALDVLARAGDELPDLRLRIAGGRVSDDSDAVLAELRAGIAQLALGDRVELLGSVADPAAELRRALCLLHCAPREPFGIAVAEALAAAVPAVVPDAGGPAEIVDGDCGVRYPPGDAGAAAAAIIALARDPERARGLGEAGRRRARAHYTVAGAQRRFGASVRALRPGSPTDIASDRHSAPAWAIVTVTHNSAAELEQLLASVARYTPEARVIVVDNASSDTSVAVAAAWAQRGVRVETVALARNIGFGAACNRGLARVSEGCVALLNPDVELLDDSLRSLVARAVTDAGDELLGPLVLSADASRQHTAHPLPGSLADRVHALIPPAALPARLAAASIAPWRATREQDTGWLVGCAIVAPTATLRRLGPFDEQIFLYGEDLDLGLRARAAGIEVRFCPRARVLHHGAHASDRAFGGEPLALLARARNRAVAINLGARAARADAATQALTFASRALLKALAGRSSRRERAQLAALLRAQRSPRRS